jgi:hypothetical protein
VPKRAKRLWRRWRERDKVQSAVRPEICGLAAATEKGGTPEERIAGARHCTAWRGKRLGICLSGLELVVYHSERDVNE